MTHPVNHKLPRIQSVFSKLLHHMQRMLNQWSTGSSLQASALLFTQQMRSMIRSNHIKLPYRQSLTQSIPVLNTLYRRVPFNHSSQSLIIPVGKPEMVHTNLTRYFFIFQRRITKQTHFACSG